MTAINYITARAQPLSVGVPLRCWIDGRHLIAVLVTPQTAETRDRLRSVVMLGVAICLGARHMSRPTQTAHTSTVADYASQ
ncbi:hypothetical protein DIE14_28085 [Burkholderia sp. Bp9017]|nr:hypothetical protein DIE14_28085 [Burkholderia sp. Bp9017]RQZ30350.1 hypothetical protein DIE13_24970 [Burkholderia sp. Bp9016]